MTLSASSRRNLTRARRAQPQRLARWKLRLDRAQSQQFADDRDKAIVAGMRVAGQLLRDRIKINLSIPVGRDTHHRVVERSRPGEFPRMETTRLRGDIFSSTSRVGQHRVRTVVGTRLEYGRELETSVYLNRAFLVPTYMEIREQLHAVLLSSATTGKLDIRYPD